MTILLQVPVTEKGLQLLFKSIGMLDSSKNVSGEDLWRVIFVEELERPKNINTADKSQKNTSDHGMGQVNSVLDNVMKLSTSQVGE